MYDKQTPNHVIGPRSAFVDGALTGLAGCLNKSCNLRCLRKDPLLFKSNDFNPSEEKHCTKYIEVNQA
jgi:hypothetical protein